VIRRLKIWWFSRKLERLIAKRRQSFEVIDYAKRRAAALKHTRGIA
jgi:hypothetical protein